jgi:hypothetical protein
MFAIYTAFSYATQLFLRQRKLQLLLQAAEPLLHQQLQAILLLQAAEPLLHQQLQAILLLQAAEPLLHRMRSLIPRHQTMMSNDPNFYK